MRVLVTGGAGFIGAHLCRYLLDQNHQVFCLDDLSTGDQRHVDALIKRSNFSFIKHDVTEPLYLPVDQIYNLACPASPIHYQKDPIKTVRTNVMGMINLLELAIKTGARILQASTSEVYGDPLEHPQTESYRGSVNCIGVRSCYDEGKRCAETLCFDYHRQKQVSIKVIRIFNTFGPCLKQGDGRVVSNFIVQALKNQDITVYGDGKQTRSFQYVSDLVDGMTKMMASAEDFTGPVNLGNPVEFTMIELAEKILKLTGSSSKLVFTPLPQDDPKQRRPDISLAKQKLDWSPQCSLDEGLKHTIAYFQELQLEGLL